MLYPQTHIPPAGTSNRLGRLGLQRRVEAAHPGKRGGTVVNTPQPVHRVGPLVPAPTPLRTPEAPEHLRQNPYHTHPERLGAQSFPQPAPPALSPGQSPEALQQGPPLDAATTVQQRGSATRTGLNRTARTTERWPGRRPAGTSPGIPRGSGNTGQRTARRWRPRSRPSPWGPWRRG